MKREEVYHNPPPTLARAQRRRLIRDLNTELYKSAAALHASGSRNPRSRKQWITYGLSATLKLAPYVLNVKTWGTTKKPVVGVLTLAPAKHPGRLQLFYTVLDSRHFSVTTDAVSCEVSRHCIERCFQRCGLQTSEEALAEVADAVAQVLKLEGVVGQIGMNTKTGRFLGTRTLVEDGKAEVIIQTYVDNAKLRPEQRA